MKSIFYPLPLLIHNFEIWVLYVRYVKFKFSSTCWYDSFIFFFYQRSSWVRLISVDILFAHSETCYEWTLAHVNISIFYPKDTFFFRYKLCFFHSRSTIRNRWPGRAYIVGQTFSRIKKYLYHNTISRALPKGERRAVVLDRSSWCFWHSMRKLSF